MESFTHLDEWFDTVLSGKEKNKLRQRTERACLKIAPVFGDNAGAKQIYRWELEEKLVEQADRDKLANTEENCRALREHLLAQVPLMEGAPDMTPEVKSEVQDTLDDLSTPVCPKTGQKVKFEHLKRALRETSVCGSDEIPIGFDTPPHDGGEFKVGNIVWLSPPISLFDLREYFDDLGDGGQKLLEKTQRKSHKTDRRLTGLYQTNREHRWEAHPQDPQAATRYECWQIEGKLLSQVFQFQGAPEAPDRLRDYVKQTLDIDSFEEVFHCPISGQIMYYDEFMREVLEADHGRSGYQIGHLDPLAVQEGHHEKENVSWISERGNRIQGEDSLKDTVEIIFNMAEFHMDRLDLEDWEDAKNWQPDPDEPSAEIATDN